MARKKRKTPGINGSSSADIAFMLLIFFLITTSMDTDKGLQRLLPPLPDNKQQDRPPVEINERNIMRLLVNRNDEIAVTRDGGFQTIKLEDLKDEVVDFIMNPTDDPNKPAKEQREVEGLGTITVTTSGYAISLKTEIETSYQMFINVQNELIKAYNEVWDKTAKQYYGVPLSELKETDPRRRNVTKEIYPMHISEMPLSNLKKK